MSVELNNVTSSGGRTSTYNQNFVSRRRTSIVPISTLNMTKEYDANAQIVRPKFEVIQKNIRETLAQIRKSEFIAKESTFERGSYAGTESFSDPEEGQQTIIAFEEPEAPSILTKPLESQSLYRKFAIQCLVVTCSVFLTWGVAFRGNMLGPNLACTSVITVSSVIVPDLVIFVGIGAYAGSTYLSNGFCVILLAFLACVFAVCQEYFAILPGRGGRLGISAILSSILTLAILLKADPNDVNSSRFYDSSTASYAKIDGYLVLNMLLSNLIGTSLTYLLRKVRPMLSPVVAGNAVTMICIFIMNAFLSFRLSSTVRNQAAGCFLQGSLAGMSTLTILPNVASVVTCGLLSGFVTILLYPIFPSGVGGKRGLMALIAVLIFVSLSDAFKMFYDIRAVKQEKTTETIEDTVTPIKIVTSVP